MELTEDIVSVLEDKLGIQRDGSLSQVTRIQNGTYTIKNEKSGEHRTFKVKTQLADARFAPGERIISVLTGSNNDNPRDYTGVGFVKEDGIAVWKKKTGGKLAALVKFFWFCVAEKKYPDFTVLMEGRCCRCNRKLTVPESITTGIGPICADRAAEDKGIDPRVVKYWRLKSRIEGTV